MTGHHAPQQPQKTEQAFSSGRELIDAYERTYTMAQAVGACYSA